jgi:hypothetical protein
VSLDDKVGNALPVQVLAHRKARLPATDHECIDRFDCHPATLFVSSRPPRLPGTDRV